MLRRLLRNEIRMYLGVALLALPSLSCVRQVTPVDAAAGCAAPTTTAEMSRCALEEAQRLEAQLQEEEERLIRVLQKIEGGNPGDTGTGRSLLEEFNRAQQAWLQYKEAECSYAYATAFGGSIRGLSAASCLRDLLKERIGRVRKAREAWERSQTAEGASS